VAVEADAVEALLLSVGFDSDTNEEVGVAEVVFTMAVEVVVSLPATVTVLFVTVDGVDTTTMLVVVSEETIKVAETVAIGVVLTITVVAAAVLRGSPPGARAKASRVGDETSATGKHVPSSKPTEPGAQQKYPFFTIPPVVWSHKLQLSSAQYGLAVKVDSQLSGPAQHKLSTSLTWAHVKDVGQHQPDPHWSRSVGQTLEVRAQPPAALGVLASMT